MPLRQAPLACLITHLSNGLPVMQPVLPRFVFCLCLERDIQHVCYQKEQVEDEEILKLLATGLKSKSKKKKSNKKKAKEAVAAAATDAPAQ